MRRVVPLVIPEGEEEELRELMAGGCKGEYRGCLSVLLRARGVHPRDVAETLGVTRRSVERWVKAYRAHGVAGLRSRKRPGRRRRIDEAQRRRIAEVALKGPEAFGYLKNEWSVRLLARHLTRELGIEISRAHVWRILRDLGIVYKRPKAVVKGPDPDYEEKARVVEDYKRAASALLKGGCSSLRGRDLAGAQPIIRAWMDA
jgi:transposase